MSAHFGGMHGLPLSAHDLARYPDLATAFFADLDLEDLEVLDYEWSFWARPEQRAPAGQWNTWAMIAGRGAGKTRSGAEWVREKWRQGTRIFHFVAPTEADYRDVMINGTSGIVSISPEWEKPRFIPSQRKLVWPNGAYALCFSSAEPDRLRGPQCEAMWADEIAGWQKVQDTWDMAMFGLRLGEHPQVMVTTTPKPLPLIKQMFKDFAKGDGSTVITTGSTYANRANLAKTFIDKIISRYEGTRLGRQEIYAEVLDDNPNALFYRQNLDELRVRNSDKPALTKIVVAVDPPVTSSGKADECGIVVAGLGIDGHAYVLADASTHGQKPIQWATRVCSLAKVYKADAIIGEVNQGGELVSTLVRQVDPGAPFRAVMARRGKWTRAEPVALLYEQGKVHHVGLHAKLEDQMCLFEPDGLAGGTSPDRVDALVYAITELLVDQGTGTNGVLRMNY